MAVAAVEALRSFGERQGLALPDVDDDDCATASRFASALGLARRSRRKVDA